MCIFVRTKAIKMKTITHLSEERGHADHGWLNAKHSFSFASWYDPTKIHFGALRVLNDDIVAPGMGFGKHPHDNMEIITIPLEGSLRHEDSMGNGSVIEAGEVQVMSAGTGIFHSEKNASTKEPINLFQLWIFPDTQQVEPRYDQIHYSQDDMKNTFLQIVSPNKEDAGTWIHQQAWIHLSEMDGDTDLTYSLKKDGNGVYIMVIDGEVTINEQDLRKRDAIGISETSSITIHATSTTRLLVIEVPMNID